MTSEPLTPQSDLAAVIRKETQPRLIDARSYKTAQVMVRTVCEAIIEEPPMLNRSELVAAFFRSKIESSFDFNPDVEGFWVFMLDRKNRLKMFTRCTEGTATAGLAHPREVFRAAVVSSACAIICAHNHPSGDPAPSSADVQITRLLRVAGETLQIQVLDHVIIGRPSADPMGKGFYSFREAGLL